MLKGSPRLHRAYGFRQHPHADAEHLFRPMIRTRSTTYRAKRPLDDGGDHDLISLPAARHRRSPDKHRVQNTRAALNCSARRGAVPRCCDEIKQVGVGLSMEKSWTPAGSPAMNLSKARKACPFASGQRQEKLWHQFGEPFLGFTVRGCGRSDRSASRGWWPKFRWPV